jgi:iron complex outermembrane receptor protein
MSSFYHSTHLLKNIVCSVLFIIAIHWAANAQTGAIKGSVQSSDGKSVPYVNVVIKASTKGTTTGEDGSYMLKNIKEGEYTLIFTYVGVQPQEKTVMVQAGQTVTLDFTLTESAQQLAEVVISGNKSMNEKPVSVGKIAIDPMSLPQSVVVLERELLDQQQSLRLSDVLKNLNGVYVMGTTGGVQEEIAGRGFAFGSSNTFKNGIRFNNGIMPETSSLEKVEVMKGSSAILFGNVAAGGILNLVTKKPKFENGGEVSMRVGSYSFYKPTVDVYGSLTKNKTVAYRLNSSYENAQSFRNEVNSQRFYVNPSLLVKPGKKTEVLVEGDYLNDDRTPDFGIGAVNYTLVDVPRSRFLGSSWAFNRVQQISTTATVSHQLTTNWQIRAIGGYQNYMASQYSTARPASNIVKEDGTWNRTLQRSKSNENYYLAQLDLIGQFNTGFLSHNLLFGGDYDYRRTESTGFKIFANPTKPDSASTAYDKINILDMNAYTQRTDMPNVLPSTLTKAPISRAGVYVQDLISITEKLKVLAGIRFTYQETGSKAYTYDASGNNPTLNPKQAPKRFDHAFTPRVGVVYQPFKSTSLFASYANSFVQNSANDLNNNPLAPSLLDQFEVGVKNDLFNGLLSANLTLYTIDYSNYAQPVYPAPQAPLNPNAQELAGSVRSKGVEIDLATKSFHGVSFIGGYSFNETRFTKSENGYYVVGSKLRYNPNHTANASVYYTFDKKSFLKGFNIGFTSVYFGDRYAGRSTTLKNPEYKLIKLDSFFQFDASAGYTLGKASLRVRVTNVFNQASYNAHDDNSINPIAPRQLAATLAYKF